MSQKSPQQSQSALLAQNRKARADYEVLEKIEAGIVLNGSEVKSVRAGHINLKGSFVEITNQLEAFTRNVHISPYKYDQHQDSYNPTRRRKLLLNKKEIISLQTQLNTEGTTIIPLDVHLSHNKIKVTIGVCRGKKKYDRRQELKKRAQDIEIKRSLKKY